jgi:hypothetical protein
MEIKVELSYLTMPKTDDILPVILGKPPGKFLACWYEVKRR